MVPLGGTYNPPPLTPFCILIISHFNAKVNGQIAQKFWELMDLEYALTFDNKKAECLF
jgi:hypothetical protein